VHVHEIFDLYIDKEIGANVFPKVGSTPEGHGVCFVDRLGLFVTEFVVIISTNR